MLVFIAPGKLPKTIRPVAYFGITARIMELHNEKRMAIITSRILELHNEKRSEIITPRIMGLHNNEPSYYNRPDYGTTQ